MGHNGGFNPYRDANGEFTTPAGSGKPGRPRRGGALSTSTRSRNSFQVGGAAPIQGSGYRGKGQDAYGAPYTTHDRRDPAIPRSKPTLVPRGRRAPGPGETVTRANPTIEHFTFNQYKLPFSGLAERGTGALYRGKKR